jgi:SAM-dependent MidA family methyltransferase
MSSYHSSAELPVPSADQIEHSALLIECIINHIRSAGGVISFRDYMQHCLYEPGLGYYAAGSAKIGKAGDFITAPETSSLFGQCLGNQAMDLFKQGLAPNILEFGAGSGKLCVDLLQHLNALQIDWFSYLILETSPDLRQRQQDYLAQHLSVSDLEKVSWLSELPAEFDGLVLANEILDAMPVSVVLKNESWIELGVGFADHKFQWLEFSHNSEAVQRINDIDAHNQLGNNYCTELNLNYGPWCQSLAQSCNNAVLLLIDYGYEQAQYYHPQRNSGTLICFYQHRSHPDPFIYPGLQDITAFVDFDAFADAALDAGFAITGMTRQADFLLCNGLLELLEHDGHNDELQQLALAQQVKTLTLPGEMGEKFKVIGLQKGCNFEVAGLKFKK